MDWATPSRAHDIGAESAKQGEALDAKIDAGKDTFKNVYGKYYGEWDKLIKQNLMSSDVSGLSGDQVKSEFTAGRLAVYPSGSWDIDSFNETGLNYGFGQIPTRRRVTPRTRRAPSIRPSASTTRSPETSSRPRRSSSPS